MTSLETPRSRAGPGRLFESKISWSEWAGLLEDKHDDPTAYSPVGSEDPNATDKHSALVLNVTSHFLALLQSRGFSPCSKSTMILFSETSAASRSTLCVAEVSLLFGGTVFDLLCQ